GVALTFGLVTAVAVLCLMVATAVTAPVTGPATTASGTPFDEAQAARVEELVGRLVAQGAPEAAVRGLVGEAVRLGRGMPVSRKSLTLAPQMPMIRGWVIGACGRAGPSFARSKQ